MLWLWRLFAGISARRPHYRSHVGPREIYGGRSGNGAVFLRVVPFSSVSDFQPITCTHLDPHDALTRWTSGRSLRIYQQTTTTNWREFDRKMIFTWICVWLYFLFYLDLLFTLRSLLLGIT